MEATTEEFLRGLDSAAQTSTILPSKNAAVEAALHKYQVEAGSPTDSTGCGPRGDGEIHSIPSQGAAVSAGDKASGHGAFLKDYRPLKQGMPSAVQ